MRFVRLFHGTKSHDKNAQENLLHHWLQSLNFHFFRSTRLCWLVLYVLDGNQDYYHFNKHSYLKRMRDSIIS